MSDTKKDLAVDQAILRTREYDANYDSYSLSQALPATMKSRDSSGLLLAIS